MTPLNQLSPEERYRRDRDFAYLVDCMTAMVDRCHYTPTELREAALLAATMHWDRTPRVFYVDAEGQVEAR